MSVRVWNARDLVGRFDRSPAATVAICALLGFLLPAAYGLWAGIPVPTLGTDETSYLLAADTFAHGRLTNPAPRHPEFFETQHILVVPTYMSKYPPGQGLILAAGRVLFGRPIWGVWLSCGCLAGCLCWMLQAWTSRRWAWITTLFFLIGGNISSYWAQSYWGGALACCGGALLFGALRRTVREPRVGTSLLLGLGVVLLAVGRPYEGALCCVPAGVVLSWWFLRNRERPFSTKVIRFAAPLAVVLAGGAGLLGIYNRAVTGSAWTLPYAVHHRQYFLSGMFVFSDRHVPGRRPHPRIVRFYEMLDRPLPKSSLSIILRNLRQRGVGVFAATLFERWAWPNSLVFMGVGWTLLATLLIVCRKDRPFWFSVVTLAWVMAGSSLIKWWMAHYSGPVMPLILALFANAGRQTELRVGRSGRGQILLALTLLALAVTCFVVNARSKADRRPVKAEATLSKDGPAARSIYGIPRSGVRFEILRQLQDRPGRHLIFVRYPGGYREYEECVYNGAELADEPMLFVHSFGPPKDGELVDDFPDRSVWLATVTSKVDVRLERYDGASLPNPKR